jgi:hypothetical protein
LYEKMDCALVLLRSTSRPLAAEETTKTTGIPTPAPEGGRAKATLTLPSALVASTMEALPCGRTGWMMVGPKRTVTVLRGSRSGRLRTAATIILGLRGSEVVLARLGVMETTDGLA